MPDTHSREKRIKHMPRRLYPDEVAEYILANYHGVGHSEMARILFEKFGKQYTREQMKAFYSNNHLKSGITGYFPKGNVPWNAGMKGWTAPGTERTQFKKGNLPYKTVPVGTESVRKDGYLYVKVAMPNKWMSKHQKIWEEHHGPLPKGHVVIFRDQNFRNFDPDNLVAVSRAKLLVTNCHYKLADDPDINDAKLMISELSLMKSKVLKKRSPKRGEEDAG